MEITQEFIESQAGFVRTLGVKFTEITPRSVRAELENRPEFGTLGGGLHGGAIMSLSDLACAVCAGVNVPESRAWTTVESNTYFLRSVRTQGSVVAIAETIKVGRSLITVQADVFDGNDAHCARTTQLVQVLDTTV